MSDRTWWPADYAPGRIDSEPVVLVRGDGYYGPTFTTRDDLPWRVHLTGTDMDQVRTVVRLLNNQETP